MLKDGIDFSQGSFVRVRTGLGTFDAISRTPWTE